MGNSNRPNVSHENTTRAPKVTKSLAKYKTTKKYASHNQTEKFIVEFSQSYHSKLTQITDIKSLDQRRVVFVSLLGLYHTYKQCPTQTLYTSIFVLPLKRDWIYRKNIFNKYTNAIFNHSATDTHNFVRLLQWKDGQGLLCFMLDDYNKHSKISEISLVHPFWVHFANMLCDLNDTITGDNYNQINLNDTYWENIYAKNKYMSKYNTKTADILSELYFLPMKFKSIKEIIHQSNPTLLNPVSFYGENNDGFKRNPIEFFQDIEVDISDPNEGDWYVSVDYEYN